MRRKDREVTDKREIREIIEGTKVLHLALYDGEYPYVVPLHFGFEEINDSYIFYAHSALSGRKLDIIRENSKAFLVLDTPPVLIGSGDSPCTYSSLYSSFMAKGRVEIEEKEEEKEKALSLIMKHQSGLDFTFNKKECEMVAIIKFTATEYSAKAKKN